MRVARPGGAADPSQGTAPDESGQAFSAFDGPSGVLVLHGLTATVATVRPLAEAIADAGFAVEAPLLPGHGTAPDDLEGKGFGDWLEAAEEAYLSLRARSDQVLVCGHSLGGTLALALALGHDEIAGLVLVNPFIAPPAESALAMFRAARESGRTQLPAIAGDIAKPGVVERAYDTVATNALLSLFDAVGPIAARLGEITCPVLLMTSRMDHVVPANHAE
ncbi:MAG TPA: alpha/beta fold hydrolase, partial [Acidimicrobiales bacterium]|nr:alpha/beta fold hydrolase [Acidimicrobiales bacterium]